MKRSQCINATLDLNPFVPHPLTLEVSRAYARHTAAGAVFLAATLAASWAGAAPQDGKVVAGQASIQQGSANTTITQSTPRAAIDWRSFNVGATESVNFVQPSASSATLNRVTGADPSAIFGRITANGQVLLINPNGIVFGRTAQVDVGGLVASTANISNANFMAGKMEFTEPGKAGAAVENQGSITVGEGGFAALVGRGVSNSGVINARLGKVSLAAGDAFVLDLYGDQLVNLVVDPAAMASMTDATGTPLAARVDHTGSITADGGKVQLTAATVKQLVDNIINVSGVVRATSFETAPGRISLKGDANTRVAVSGSLETSGAVGGRIEVTGRDVTLASAARLNATGSTAGGNVSVGGDWQGKGPLLNAKLVTIEPGAQIDASATGHGHGGTVAIWSDERTRFEGRIDARGGAQAGNGGNVEVSSKGQLGFLGDVDVFAARGLQGAVLLDPANLRIGTVSSGDSEVSAEQIRFLLTRGASVTLAADQNVTVDAEVNGLATSGVPRGGLTLTAGNDLTVNRSIVLNDGALNLTATGGTLSSAAGTLLYTGSGVVNLRGGAGVDVDRVLSAGAVDIRSANGGVTVRNAIVAATATGAVAPAASVLIAGAGAVTLNGAFTNGDATITSTSAGIALNNGPIESKAGNINLDARGGGIVGQAQGIGLKAGGNVTATASGAIGLDAVVGTGAVTLTTSGTGAVTIGQAVDAGSLTISAGGPVTLHGAKAGVGGMAISLQSGNITSDGGLLSAGSVAINAAGGQAGTASQLLNVGVISGAGGQILVEGRDGVFADSLLTEGPVVLRSSAGGVEVRQAVAGQSAASLAEAPASRDLLVAASGDVKLAGAKVGAGGLTVRGYENADSSAKSFTLEGGTALSAGPVNVTTSGPITIGIGGIQITSTGVDASLNAGGPIQLNGDIDAKAGTISLTSGGSITALVNHPGGDPNASDASLNAGRDDVLSKIIVDSKSGDITLGGMVAQSEIKIYAKSGNVLLLSSLGGNTTGYENYDNGYQERLRPDVGRLEIVATCAASSAPACGSVELNGLNLDGNRNEIDASSPIPGLKVAADHMIVSNRKIAVNKGNILLDGGHLLATDGVYLGDAIYSRGWDSVGADGKRSDTDDVKIGYNISISGRVLGLLDNTTEYATIPNGTAQVTVNGTTRYRTDLQGYLVDASGQRLSPLQVVSLDLTQNPITQSTPLVIYQVDSGGSIINAGDRRYGSDPSVLLNGNSPQPVRGQIEFRDIAKIIISNNTANYQNVAPAGSNQTAIDEAQALRSRLVPHTHDPSPENEINILVDSIAGVGNARPVDGRLRIDSFSPILVPLSQTPAEVASRAAGVIASTQGIGLKLLGFERIEDQKTFVWGKNVQLTPTGGIFGYFDGLVDGTSLSTIAVAPVSGLFSVTAPAEATRTYYDSQTVSACDPSLCEERRLLSSGTLTYNFRISPDNIITLIGMSPDSAALAALAAIPPDLQPTPGNIVSSPWKFGRESNYATAVFRFLPVGAGESPLALAGGRSSAITLNSYLYPSTRVDQLQPIIQTGPQTSPILNESAGSIHYIQPDGSIGSTIIPARDSLDVSIRRIIVDTSASGSYSSTTAGTRMFVFDGVIETLLSRSYVDGRNGVVVPGLGVAGTNNSGTGFLSVGPNFGLPTGGTGSISVGAANSGSHVGSTTPASASTGLQIAPDRLDQSSADFRSESSQREASSNNVVIGQRPAAQADLGRSGGVAGYAINVAQKRFRLANSLDPALCAPDVIQAAPSTSEGGTARDCK